MLTALVQRISAGRTPGLGRPPAWVTETTRWHDKELAAAVLFHIVRARLWAEVSGLDPLYSTIATALGADLVGLGPHTDRDLPLKVGCPLLDLAEKVGIIALVRDARNGIHVALTPSTYRRLQQLLDGGAPHVLHRVSPLPPVGVETRKRHDMLEPRPEAPPRVVEAANKVQGTAWRINRAVLETLDAPRGRAIRRADIAEAQVIVEARELAALERFYFPVFLDFRGRVYQQGGMLNYTGRGDYARGLLEFADGEFVDDEGMKWLTWHMAQMWGAKGLPLGDGTAWVREASRRVEHWQDAKYPAQFLAAALAVVDASEGRPVHLPVRVDATCSGLQHLALLSRDTELAQLVNLWGHYGEGASRRGRVPWLEPEPPQEDFYTIVHKQTSFPREEVKAVIVPMLYGAGEDTSGVDLAEARSGSKKRSARKDVRTIRAEAKRQAEHAFALLRWFGQVAVAHNKAGGVKYTRREGRKRKTTAGVPIRWTAPSGFRAVQDYRYVEKNPTRYGRRVQIIVGGRRVSLVKRFYTEIIDKRQQAKSLSSSIVHSLDAALLAEIVAGSRIRQWGVAHDAFCVPAGSVWDLLDQDNPRAMAHVYGPDRIAEWVAEWRAAGVDVPDPPGGTDRGALPREMLGGLRTLG